MSKTNFEYYRQETNRYQDIKIKRLNKRFKCDGIAILDKIEAEIFRINGYYLEYNEDVSFDIADYFKIDEEVVNDVVKFCCEIGIFDLKMFQKGILTSILIQDKYVEMSKAARRSTFEIAEEIQLFTEEISKMYEETEEMCEKNTKMHTKTPKVKERKVKERKVKERKQPEAVFCFEKEMIDFGFEKKLVSEWLLIRKKKKVVNTETSYRRFISQIQKAGRDKNEILEIIVSKSWIGFEAEWLNTNKSLQNGTIIKNSSRTIGKISEWGKF